MTESELLNAVLDLASLLGYRCYHTRPARTNSGWRTPAQGNAAKGFPDVVCAKPGRLVFAELKTARGQLSLEQRGWLGTLAAGPAETHVWRPSDWLDGTIERTLR